MLKPILTSMLVALMPAAAWSEGKLHHDHGEHLAEADGLRALHAWTPASDDDIALVFVELENTDDHAITLTGVGSEIATKGALVGFTLVDGEGTYVPLDHMVLAAKRDMALTPNGLAIQLSGVKTHRHQGEAFHLHLVTDHGELEIEVAVEAHDAHQHSHAGHSH